MKCQRNRGATWTTLELGELLEDEDCHVHFTRTTKHLALHPYHLNNIQRGVNQILRSLLNTYERELKGFVLAFRNPKLLSNLGELLYDSPFIHIDIEADFYLFRPMVGSFLKGIVNKKGLDYIVMLVHKIYTVSIPKPDDTEEWPGDSVEIGQEIKCCVTQIHHKSKPPFICATLRSDYSQGCRLSESITNIDNVDSAIESANSTTKIDSSANGISEDDSISKKVKKKHRKKHKSLECNSEFICKIENESESNVESDTSRTIKSEKKQQYQSTVLDTDSLNNSEVDNSIPKKHKKSKKTSKSLLNSDTILDEHTESRKTVKRENSIPLDSITEIETKKKKKHAKKSKEFDPESVVIKIENEEMVNDTKNISYIKSEEEQHKKHIISNTNIFSNNLEDSISKKHKKKNKKSPMIMSDSESESHIVKIKTEKQDPCRDRIANEKSKSHTYSETQVVQNLNETFEMPKFIKKEKFMKKEKEIFNKHDDSEKEWKKSPKKHANVSRDSDSEIKIKSENITNDINGISRKIKYEPKESQNINTAINSDSINSDLDHISRKSKKKKKTSMILLESELKHPIKIEKE